MSKARDAFSKRLQTLICECSETMKQISDNIEVKTGYYIAPASLSGYLNNKSAAGIEPIRAIAEYYDVTSDWLLGLTDDRLRQPSAVDELGLPNSTIEKLKRHTSSPAFKYTIISLIEEAHMLQLLSSYLWAFTLNRLPESEYSLIPLKKEYVPKSTERLNYAMIMERLPLFKKSLEEQYGDNMPVIYEFLLSYLRKNADIEECEKVIGGYYENLYETTEGEIDEEYWQQRDRHYQSMSEDEHKIDDENYQDRIKQAVKDDETKKRAISEYLAIRKKAERKSD